MHDMDCLQGRWCAFLKPIGLLESTWKASQPLRVNRVSRSQIVFGGCRVGRVYGAGAFRFRVFSACAAAPAIRCPRKQAWTLKFFEGRGHLVRKPKGGGKPSSSK